MDVLEYLDAVSNGNYTSVEYSSRNGWLKGRAGTIGASDSAAVIGKSPWMTEADLWERKAFPETAKVNEGNASTDRGHRSENHIRELYAIETGLRVYDGTNIILTSVEHPFMSCTLDGIVKCETPKILEIKSVRWSREWCDDMIPQHYLAQCLHQLAVTGWEEAILLARFIRTEGWDMANERCYHIVRSDYKNQIEKLIWKEEEFWSKYVLTKKRPPVRMPKI